MCQSVASIFQAVCPSKHRLQLTKTQKLQHQTEENNLRPILADFKVSLLVMHELVGGLGGTEQDGSQITKFFFVPLSLSVNL